MVAVCRYQHHT